MPAFNLSDLKGKVSSGRSAINSKVSSLRADFRENSSPKASPPVPPPRVQTHYPQPRAAQPRFSENDKVALFSMLDSFFESKQGRPAPSVLPLIRIPPVNPPANMATHPSANPSVSSVPPQTLLKSPDALTFTQYFSPTTPWTTDPTWFAWDTLPHGAQPTPPPLASRTDIMRATSWSSRGPQKSLQGIVLFEDLSISWYHLSWQYPQNVIREAAWTPPPEPWIAEDLVTCSELYGDLVASFAERALRERRHVGRGECWDLANDALQSIAIEQINDVPKPMPSIGHTHGHLVFSGTAGSVGSWRGGDNTIRRGDIVQWLRVTIKLVGQLHTTMTLGEPDHTAVVVSDTHVSSLALDGDGYDDIRPLHPSEIGSLEVVEQSVRELPTRRTYDMKQFMSGQVWIYRPVPMETYLGIADVTPDWPPPSTAKWL